MARGGLIRGELDDRSKVRPPPASRAKGGGWWHEVDKSLAFGCVLLCAVACFRMRCAGQFRMVACGFVRLHVLFLPEG